MSARSIVLLVASLCLGVPAVLALDFGDSDLVLLREHLNHPFAFGLLACTLTVLAALGLRWAWLRTTVIILAGLGGCVTLLGGLVVTAFTAAKEVGYVEGPGPYSIRLRESTGGLGPDQVTWLSVRKDDGFLSKEWHLGCFDDDDPSDAFDAVTWTGPASVEVRVTDGRTFPVTLDASGRPRTTAELNC
ncbi:hypothetical protein SAMN05421874_10220 [Nonomuraea maritima]|uniref:Uncharacterized protein n=1 Tax=Nonomuraea maritima TaxID=683260 RepID=A0A1G8U9D8_9ACTN|nr:hypothetical protein [Nonomuraea maritima]SDJ50351.1 hypothetical protein SAMN05421874_10220 [Nonomuraea maritima]